MNQKEQGGFGDQATITLNAGAKANETVGIGIDNLKQRLKLLYPDKHKIELEINKGLKNKG